MEKHHHAGGASVFLICAWIGAIHGLAIITGCGAETVIGCPDAETGQDAGPDMEMDAETGGEADPSIDAGPDADADGPAPPPCPAPIADSCPEDATYPFYPLPVLVQAADLGPGTRFVNVSPGPPVVLAEREEAGSRTIVIFDVGMDGEDPLTAGRAELALPPGSALLPVAAVACPPDHAGTALPDHVALLCDGAACSLYGADYGPGEVADLAPIPGGEVPASAGMRGLWWQDGPAACAYGDGIHCFDGNEWTSVVASDPGAPDLNDMETCAYLTVAAGDMGFIVESGWPSWHGDYGMIYPDLLTVACGEDGFIAAGEGGTVMDGSRRFCDVADEDILFIDMGDVPYAGLILGVTSSGRVFIGRKPLSADSGLCYTEQTVGPLVAGTAEACGIIYNYFLLTADTLYGTTSCAIE